MNFKIFNYKNTIKTKLNSSGSLSMNSNSVFVSTSNGNIIEFDLRNPS